MSPNLAEPTITLHPSGPTTPRTADAPQDSAMRVGVRIRQPYRPGGCCQRRCQAWPQNLRRQDTKPFVRPPEQRILPCAERPRPCSHSLRILVHHDQQSVRGRCHLPIAGDAAACECTRPASMPVRDGAGASPAKADQMPETLGNAPKSCRPGETAWGRLQPWRWVALRPIAVPEPNHGGGGCRWDGRALRTSLGRRHPSGCQAPPAT